MRVGMPVSSEEASNFQVVPPSRVPINPHSGIRIDRQVRFAGPAIDHHGIFRVDRERSDVQRVMIAPKRAPGSSGVVTLPDTARRRARPDAVRFFRMTNDARHPAADVGRTDALPHHTFGRGQSSLRSISLAHKQRAPAPPATARRCAIETRCRALCASGAERRPTILFQIHPARSRLQFHHFFPLDVGGMLGATRGSRPAYSEQGSMSIDRYNSCHDSSRQTCSLVGATRYLTGPCAAMRSSSSGGTETGEFTHHDRLLSWTTIMLGNGKPAARTVAPATVQTFSAKGCNEAMGTFF